MQGHDGGDMHRGRERVVRGLRTVHVIIRMNPQRIALSRQFFIGDMRDYFVHIHVGLRAGTGLVHDQRKFIGPLTRQNFIAHGFDNVRFLRVQLAEIRVYFRRAFFQYRKRPNNFLRHPLTDFEIFKRTLGLRSPFPFRGNPHFAHSVVLYSISQSFHSL